MSERQRILMQPQVDPSAIDYMLKSTAVTLVCSVVGIFLLPIVLPLTWWYYHRYYANLRVVLTTRDLQIDRGVWNREEKRIPLEKITDLATFQGPIMRYLGIKGLRVETAGQSAGPNSALVRIIGLRETEDFRERVLDQRDRIADQDSAPTEPRPAASTDATLALMKEMHDTMLRIEQRLGEQDR